MQNVNSMNKGGELSGDQTGKVLELRADAAEIHDVRDEHRTDPAAVPRLLQEGHERFRQVHARTCAAVPGQNEIQIA